MLPPSPGQHEQLIARELRAPSSFSPEYCGRRGALASLLSFFTMVFYFVSCGPGLVIYMGKDKFENEDLIKWAWPEDIWHQAAYLLLSFCRFHVDDYSSAHVYLRLPPGQTMDNIPEAVLEDCAQLVKANSIQGNKINNVNIVYTPASNLKKSASMDVGQVRKTRVEKRINEIVNRLNKTKEEKSPDLQAEKEKRDAAERAGKKTEIQKKKQNEQEAKEKKKAEQELKSYSAVMKEENMKSNKNTVSEDDFM